MAKYKGETIPLETGLDLMNNWGVYDYSVIDCTELDKDLKQQLLLQHKITPTKQYLDFLKSTGFSEENYKLLLELNQEPYGSVSPHISINQFLLSESIYYSELNELNIKGAKGHLTKDGIHISKMPDDKLNYEVPNIEEEHSVYDVVVSKGLSYWDNLDLIFKNEIDYYLGQMFDTNDPNYITSKKEFTHTLSKINQTLSNPGKIVTEQDSQNGNDFVLLYKNQII